MAEMWSCRVTSLRRDGKCYKVMKNPYLRSILLLDLRFSWLKVLAIVLGITGCLGMLVISRGDNQVRYYFFRQVIWLIISTWLLLVVSSMPLHWLTRKPLLLYAGLCGMLLAVLFLGATINGMRGWFKFYSVCVQPTELAKPFFVLCFAGFCSNQSFRLDRTKVLAVSLPGIAFWVGLILSQPDCGTSMVYCLVFLTMFWCSGAKIWHLCCLAGSGAAAAAVMLWRYPYIRRRLLAFVNPGNDDLLGAGWQAAQMQECLARGGCFGVPFDSSQPLLQVPYRMNDSFVASLGEQLGVFGIAPLILLSLAWLSFCCSKAVKTQSVFHRLLFVGSGVMLSGQAFLHLAVNLGLFPTTGVTLPLFSYGGSSLLASLLIIGIVDNCLRTPATTPMLPQNIQ